MSKITVFGTFLVTIETGRGDLAKMVQRRVFKCASGKVGKFPALTLVKWTFFHIQSRFFHWSLPKIWNSNLLMNYFFKYFAASKRLKTFGNI